MSVIQSAEQKYHFIDAVKRKNAEGLGRNFHY